VELKPASGRRVQERTFVWIEPEWNWNVRVALTRRLARTVWIEPEWNWNFLLFSTGQGIVSTFESNQSGIETNWSLHILRRSEGLNRTRVELKQALHSWREDEPPCLNRTRVELKQWVLAHLRLHNEVWIEPEWNWNAHHTPTVRTTRRRLNRTRVELKLFDSITRERMCTMFESNQSGIETPSNSLTTWSDLEFESNQSGIETPQHRGAAFYPVSVWIEPEWNWNFVSKSSTPAAVVGLNRTRVELKRLLFTRFSIGCVSLNRTRVELKQSCRRETARRRRVWIEPEWNWNTGSCCGGVVICTSLNRTRVELKQPPAHEWWQKQK